MRNKKRGWIILFSFIAIFILTNPNETDFKNFLKLEFKEEIAKKEKGLDDYAYGRVSYFGLFSIYKISSFPDWRYDTYYLGIFKNFIEITEK